MSHERETPRGETDIRGAGLEGYMHAFEVNRAHLAAF